MRDEDDYVITFITYEQVMEVYNQLPKEEQLLMHAYPNTTEYSDSDNIRFRLGYFRNDKLLGFLEAYIYEDDCSYLSIAVLPNYRKQGIATELLSCVHDINIKYVVNKKNKISIEFAKTIFNNRDDVGDCYVYTL